MVKKQDLKLKGLVEQLTETKQLDKEVKDQNRMNYKGVVLFFSFDIVNSTIYKTKEPNWPKTIKKIFDYISQFISNAIPGSTIWRMLGDEIIYIVPVNSQDYLNECVQTIYHVLQNVINKMNKTGSELILSLKGTAWIAYITDRLENKIPGGYNLHFQYPADLSHGRDFVEFIGNDIDAGFRIKAQAFKGQLVVSFELAYLLAKYLIRSSSNDLPIYIIGLRKLKGIWNNKPYPIICFHNGKWSGEEKEYIIEGNGNYPKSFSEDIMPALERICKDNQLKTKINFLTKQLANSTIVDVNDIMNNHHDLQLHLAVVCCDFKNKKVLIAKRSSKHKRFKNTWEFGCAKADRNQSYEKAIQKDYGKDFPGLLISVIKDSARSDKSPKPYALYEVKEDENEGSLSDKGIIVFAKILNTDFDEIRKTDKHSEIKFIGQEDLEKFFSSKPKCVQDFRQTLNAAFQMMDEVFRDSNGKR